MSFLYGRHLQKIIKVVILALLLQGCERSGNGINQLASDVGSGINPALKVAPIPLEANLSQISYMSCPQAGANNQNTDLLSNPVYRFRFGSYDNSALTGGFNSLSGTHVGGVGFSTEAINYLKRADPNPNVNMLSSYLSSSPYTKNYNLVAALIYRDRTPDLLSYTALATPLLANITGSAMIPVLINAPITATGTQKSSYFQTIPSSARRSLAGSLNWGASESDENTLRGNLFTQFLYIGYAPSSYSDPQSIIKNLASPDGDVTKRLFGRGYSLTFLGNDPTVSTVSEWDLNPSGYSGGMISPVDLTTQENQSWDCFTLGVVRDTDRKYWQVKPAIPGLPSTCGGPATCTQSSTCNCSDYLPAGTATPINVDGAYLSSGSIVHPKDVRSPLLYGLLKEFRFGSTTEANLVTDQIAIEYAYSSNGANPPMPIAPSINTNSAKLVQRGTFAPCPSEDPLDPLNPMTAREKERLRIVRRFLSPDFWDVNIRGQCIVPRQKMVQSGAKCYSTGDNDISKYIQYDTSFGPCGPSPLTECRAKVNFCWRFQ